MAENIERDMYLEKFKRENQPDELFNDTNIESTGKMIVDILKKRRLDARTGIRKPPICLQFNQV